MSWLRDQVEERAEEERLSCIQRFGGESITRRLFHGNTATARDEHLPIKGVSDSFRTPQQFDEKEEQDVKTRVASCSTDDCSIVTKL